MNPWIETLGATLLAALGGILGWWFARLPRPWWSLGYFLPFAIVLLIGSTRWRSGLEFVAPMSWLVEGRTEFALGGFAGVMLLATPLFRLPRPRDRAAVLGFVVLLVALTSVWPFLAPAFNRRELAAMRTKIDADGICRQSNDYTCGPAAAVTVLRRLGIPAEEGAIGIAACTSTAIGTPPDLLYAALQKLYPTNGVDFQYRHFQSVEQLKDDLTLAVIKFGLLVDHYVAVLEVNSTQVVTGDPFRGHVTYSPADFARQWRHTGIVVRKRD